MDQNYITLLDVRYFLTYLFRKPSVPLLKLRNHKDNVNAIAWAPQSAVHMCSVGDDCKAYIWDLSTNRHNDQTPLLEYKADEQITNLSWSNLQK
jgi:WD repeat-containing protein 68